MLQATQLLIEGLHDIGDLVSKESPEDVSLRVSESPALRSLKEDDGDLLEHLLHCLVCFKSLQESKLVFQEGYLAQQFLILLLLILHSSVLAIELPLKVGIELGQFAL